MTGLPDTTWMADGACLDHDPELWFGADPEQGKAKAICETCPVIDDCRTHAIRQDERIGVWGGLDQNQLDLIRTRRRRHA